MTTTTRPTVAELNRRLGELLATPAAREGGPLPFDEGRARFAEWEAEDGYEVAYTTTRIEGGLFDGRFAFLGHRVASRTESGVLLVLDAWGITATRRAARERAESLYRQHSPRWAKRHPRGATS